MKTAVVNNKGSARARGGHPWVFKSDVLAVEAENGDAVLVNDRAGNPVGTAFYSSRSQITLRFFDGRHVEPDGSYFTGKLNAAAALRDGLYGGAATGGKVETAVRVFFGESDGIPAVIIDRYGPVAVIQTLCPGAEALKGLITDWCLKLPGVEAVVERNDPRVRELEGLPRFAGILAGELPAGLAVLEGGVSFPVDVLKGQKTGAFLDQRDNRDAAAADACGRALDAFCYQGWFASRIAAGADEVVAVDVSAEAVAAAKAGADRLGLKNLQTVQANAFDYLRECDLRGEKFDVIILDPPAFAKNKSTVEAARRGYREINLRAMKLLNPGGRLFTFSCSYNMTGPLFDETIREAAADSGRRVILEKRLAQSLDHPVMITFPESSYLKGFMLRVE
jgi:23S rRNA (cytosine1962-C5)-methyltransferase